MKLFIILYWTWLSISLLILGRRLLLRVTRSASQTPSPEARSFDVVHTYDTDKSSDPIHTVDPIYTSDPIQTVDPNHRGDTDQADVEAASPSLTTGQTNSVDHAPVVEHDTVRPALGVEHVTVEKQTVEPQVRPTQPTAGRPLAGTVFAPLNPPTPSLERMRINRTYLADALQGISMPCDLAPLINVEGVDPARRAVFSTSSADADMVGSSISSELSRLGYSLEAISTTEALARRGEDAVNVRINAIGPAPKKGPADPRFPTAAGNSIVLDLEIA